MFDNGTRRTGGNTAAVMRFITQSAVVIDDLEASCSEI